MQGLAKVPTRTSTIVPHSDDVISERNSTASGIPVPILKPRTL
jgi:hypothetical protein